MCLRPRVPVFNRSSTSLGFRPHTQAQRLAAGKSRTIAFVHPIEYLFDKSNLADTDFILGSAAAAAEEGYMFNLVTIPVEQDSLVGLYRSAQVDGVILMEIHLEDWRVDLLRERNLPFTMVGHCADNDGLSFVDMDFENAVRLLSIIWSNWGIGCGFPDPFCSGAYASIWPRSEIAAGL